MSKKCPPGTFCIENMTLVFTLLIIFIVLYFAFPRYNVKEEVRWIQQPPTYSLPPFTSKPNTIFTNIPGDTLMNPYAPPLKPPDMPINIPTNIGYNYGSSYRQIGILTPVHKQDNTNERILPLMGRPLFTNRDKWQYYTMSDQNNSVKLPILVKGRNGMNEYGVDSVYDKDTVVVEGYKQAFHVTIYDNTSIQYIPSLSYL